MKPNSMARRQVALVLALVALFAFAALSGGEALRLSERGRSAAPADPRTPTGSAGPVAGGPSVGRPGAPEERGGPGSGVVIGRLVDGRSGLPVRDGGVTLLELGRRTITLPDGQFRFDGITPGVHTLVVGPAEGYLPASRTARVLGDGADLGSVTLAPADPPTRIEPQFGGRVPACQGTELQLPRDALLEASPIQLTCIEAAGGLPAPAPPGRLPLAAVDAAPGRLALVQPARLLVELPVQPRYGPGVELDLLRLDLERLIWVPSGSLRVEEGGRRAAGEITALGTYMAAAPPFGTFLGAGGERPTLTRINTAASAAGQPESRFPAGSPAVYLSFDYAGMAGTPLRVRTVDRQGDIVFEQERRYDGAGREDLPMLAERGAWPTGSYVTTLYLGQPAVLHSLEWQVGLQPSPMPDGPLASSSWTSPPVAGPPPASRLPVAGCPVPGGWYSYRVVPGDTLGAIAERTGSSVAALARANCLDADRIQVGQAIYVPDIPWQRKPPRVAPATALPLPTTVAPTGPTRLPGLPTAPPALREPKATRPPDPTLAPRPYPSVDPGRFVASPVPPPPTAELGSRGQPVPGPGAAPKATRPPDPTLAPRPTDPPMP